MPNSSGANAGAAATELLEELLSSAQGLGHTLAAEGSRVGLVTDTLDSSLHEFPFPIHASELRPLCHTGAGKD